MIGVNTAKQENVYGLRQNLSIIPDTSLLEVAEASITEGLRQTAMSAANRIWEDIRPRQRRPDEERLTVDYLNQEYGIEGVLEFTEEEYQDRAVEMYKAGLQRMVSQDILSRGIQARPLTGTITSFAVGMLAQLADPVEIGLMFIPIVGEAKLSSTVARSPAMRFLTEGLIKRESISAMVGGSKLGTRFATGLIDASIGSAIVEPLIYYAARSENERYTFGDSAINVAAGGVLGGAIHTLGGINFLRTIEEATASISDKTRHKAFQAAIAEIAEGSDVDAAGNIVAVDENYIRIVLTRHTQEQGTLLSEQQMDTLVQHTQEQLLKDNARAVEAKLNEAAEPVEQILAAREPEPLPKPKRKVKEPVETVEMELPEVEATEVETKQREFTPETEEEQAAFEDLVNLELEAENAGMSLEEVIEEYNRTVSEADQIDIDDLNKVENASDGIRAAMECVLGKI